MYYGFIRDFSILYPLEDSFFCLKNFALRAVPGIGYIFPYGSNGNSVSGIPFYRIIDVVAFQANPPFTFTNLCHTSSTPCIVFCYPYLFVNIYESAPPGNPWYPAMGGTIRVCCVSGRVNRATQPEGVRESFPQG